MYEVISKCQQSHCNFSDKLQNKSVTKLLIQKFCNFAQFCIQSCSGFISDVCRFQEVNNEAI